MFFERRAVPVPTDHDEPQLAMPFHHRVFGDPLERDFPGSEVAYFAMGCFWGAEKLFWQTDGVLSTAAGYMGGSNRNPSYEEVCTGLTGHAETVRVVFDPSRTSYRELLAVFLENHDPTQGDRQGNDVGPQYRSAIFTTSPEQEAQAREALAGFQQGLTHAGYGTITTTVEPAPQWYFAEDLHQQYLEHNPNGYCPVHATGVTCG
ncbi:peptide-methionine (S)-S-oxide reductase MsrA [Luteococcus peritonei]|uniref:Peptide methionine sulfoxide reductase MsrA n=1 Tax=Luteococcus peritonei TaxID=88874 RepID=A0ABW4RZ67_9ACTN